MEEETWRQSVRTYGSEMWTRHPLVLESAWDC